MIAVLNATLVALIGMSQTRQDAPTSAATHAPSFERSRADRVARRALRLDDNAPQGTQADAQKAFQTSILISSVRCTLMYVVFPFVLPAIGIAAGVGPWIGVVIGSVALVSIPLSMRRFFGADHPKRWWYFALGGVMWCFMLYSVIFDLHTILTN